MEALGKFNCHCSQQWLRLEPRAGYARNGWGWGSTVTAAGNPVWPLVTDAVADKTRPEHLRIMPEGMEKCTRFAPYGLAGGIWMAQPERWMRVECLLLDGNCNSSISSSSCLRQLPVRCVCVSFSCHLPLASWELVWMQISRTRYRKSQELQPIKWKLPSVELSAQQ